MTVIAILYNIFVDCKNGSCNGRECGVIEIDGNRKQPHRGLVGLEGARGL
jgi:hypothetical protein